MKIDELVKKIPEITASFYERILIGNKKNDESFTINYTGDKVRVSKSETYQNFLDVLESTNINLKREKQIIDDKLIICKNEDDYEIIFIIDTKVEKELANDLKTILFADDSKVVQNFFKNMFEDEYNIIIASNGEEVIKIVEDKKEEIKGLFLDLQMPITSGYQVLEYFSEYDLFDVIPVSIMSGEDDKDNINEIMENYKIVDMIQKPFDKKSAKTIIEKTLEFGPRS